MNKTNYSEKEIYNLIAGIPDPEIPVITIEDLGILREVSIKDDKILISICSLILLHLDLTKKK